MSVPQGLLNYAGVTVDIGYLIPEDFLDLIKFIQGKVIAVPHILHVVSDGDHRLGGPRVLIEVREQPRIVSPMETMEMTEPIPMIMPSIVRNERILFAMMAWKAMINFRLASDHPTLCSGCFPEMSVETFHVDFTASFCRVFVDLIFDDLTIREVDDPVRKGGDIFLVGDNDHGGSRFVEFREDSMISMDAAVSRFPVG